MNKQLERTDYILFSARLLIGGLFFSSGLSKLIRPIEYFEMAILQYQFIPASLVPMIGKIVPWTELILGTYLFLGFSTRFAGKGLSILTAGFQFMLAQALIRQVRIDECGCFGGTSIKLSLYQSFTLDTVILIALILIATSEKNAICSIDAKFRSQNNFSTSA